MNADLVRLPTRGERNNNPGNIDYEPGIPDVGLIGREIAAAGQQRFARYATPHDGIRAIARILHTYMTEHGCTSVRRIIMRWAPPGDGNDTVAYVKAVAAEAGLGADQELACDAGDNAEITRAIIHHENGRVIYDDALIADAVGAALA